MYWTNFNLPNNVNERKLDGILCTMNNEVQSLSEFHDYDFYKYKGKQRRDKMARNLVDYEVGKTIFEIVCGIVRKENEKQTELF